MRRIGFSLVELLVAIAIIGALVALLLPAIQAGRESARLAQCKNNLRQLAVGLNLHHDQVGHFPYGGWGYQWRGIANRGFGRRQPGGWVYNILPFIEMQALHDLLTEGSSTDVPACLATPIVITTCPSRRPCQAWPVSSEFAYMSNLRPSGTVQVAARGDYAINSGATSAFSFEGPPDLTAGDSRTFKWPSDVGALLDSEVAFSGISHLRRGMRAQGIEDGLSATYLAGEKFVELSHYEDGEFLGDNEAVLSGFSNDNHRYARLKLEPLPDSARNLDTSAQLRFGSAHVAGVVFATCDGAVALTSFDVDDEIYFRAGHVADGGKPTTF